ncbi:unnamed protein product [Symbiodinium microadriaticum]|nr:unnamed protein product [Symbiodinium microadriaticum]
MVLRFLVLIGAAAVLKVSCGSDDLVWLAPFIAREKTRLRKAWVAFLYTVSVAFLVSIAAAAGLITNSMKGEKADLMKWWLKFLAGSLLIVYSVYMAYVDGWLKPCGLKGPDDEEEDDKRRRACFRPMRAPTPRGHAATSWSWHCWGASMISPCT